MKKTLRIAILVFLLVLFGSTQAPAIGINFMGPSFTLSDANSDGFSEQLSFANALVTLVDPASDAIFGDVGFEIVQLSPLYLDPANYIPGSSYNFNPNTYVGGFSVYDDDGTALFSADLTASALNTTGQTGTISPFVEMNLTNITANASYITGSSVIIDSFLNAPYGDATITLQLAGTTFGTGIENGLSFSGTYSGAVSPVPEPATMLLLGSGLIGFAAFSRRKFSKK